MVWIPLPKNWNPRDDPRQGTTLVGLPMGRQKAIDEINERHTELTGNFEKGIETGLTEWTELLEGKRRWTIVFSKIL
jgi:hypothetical protein